jgi:hypothetical protein
MSAKNALKDAIKKEIRLALEQQASDSQLCTIVQEELKKIEQKIRDTQK